MNLINIFNSKDPFYKKPLEEYNFNQTSNEIKNLNNPKEISQPRKKSWIALDRTLTNKFPTNQHSHNSSTKNKSVNENPSKFNTEDKSLSLISTKSKPEYRNSKRNHDIENKIKKVNFPNDELSKSQMNESQNNEMNISCFNEAETSFNFLDYSELVKNSDHSYKPVQTTKRECVSTKKRGSTLIESMKK